MFLRSAVRAPNPWLAGKPLIGSLQAMRSLHQQTMSQQKRAFSATRPNQDLITPLLSSMHFMHAISLPHMIYYSITWLIGHCYNVYPWFLLLFLVTFLFTYGARLGDYDRGQMFNINMIFHDPNDCTMAGRMSHDQLTWQYLSDHFWSVTMEEAEKDKKRWSVDEDGVIEPALTHFDAAGLSAFHLLNSISLRWDLVTHAKDFNDSWSRTAYVGRENSKQKNTFEIH